MDPVVPAEMFIPDSVPDPPNIVKESPNPKSACDIPPSPQPAKQGVVQTRRGCVVQLPKNQCPYLLKFVDIVLDVEVTTDLIIKLRIRRMVFTRPLVDIHVR